VDQEAAYQVAERGLARALPRRWRHAQAVAACANHVAVVVPGNADLLIAAAWLHDVGYAPAIARTGFHPLDGARYLCDLGAGQRLCGLVAHHSGAAIEARLRGLDDILVAEFQEEHSYVADALWYADLTTGPDGEVLTVEERLEEIAERYGRDDVVTVFVELARPELIAAVRRTEARLEHLAAQSR
jgi:HD domain